MPGKTEKLKNNLSAEILKTSMQILQKIPDKVKDRAKESINSGNVYEILEDYKPRSGILHASKMKNYVPEPEVAKNLKRLEKLIVQFVQAVSISYYLPYINVYLKFKKYLETVKIAKSETIHIDDVNKKLAGYIERDVVPTIYFKLGEKIVHFLIDEFQDTNRLQWLNIRPLVEESLAKKGSIFIVGDIKQAIYMFRNADYRIIKDFLNVAEGKSHGARYISLESIENRIEFSTLNINRRSDGMILKYVDDLFKNKLKNATSIIGNDITELTSFRQEILKERKDAGYVKTEIIENVDEDETEPKEKARLTEIIKYVRKRYNLNEIVILVPKNKKIEPIVRWLTKEGIEMASASSLDIRNRKIISEILSLLKFLDSPVDNLSFAGFISGDVFQRVAGIKKEEIYQLMFKKNTNPDTKEEYLYQCFRNNSEFAQTWQNYFEEIYKKVGFLSLYEIVALAFEKFEVLKKFPDEAAFLVRFLEVVSLLQAKGINNVRDFIEFAQEEDEEANQIFSVILPEYVNAVRIMTFHKAKGLGFPVVINMIYDERGESNPMYFHESSPGVIQVYYIKNDFAEKSNDLNEIYTLKKSDENVQNLNVLYVITTRAKNEMYNLIIRRVRKKLVKTLPEKLTDIFEDVEIGKPSEDFPKEIKVEQTTHISAYVEHFAEFESPAKWTIQRHLESKEGELYHHVLSKLEYLSDVSDSLIGKIVEETFNKYNFEFDKDKIKDTLVDFLKIKEVREWFSPREGRTVKTEVEFHGQKKGLLRMDRVVFDGETISVIDFKTGRQELVEYEDQIKKYVQVIREIYPEKRVKGVLAYIDLKKIVSVLK
jgi:ATP-dependent exoDNAse (exonuclease V) beta subunit